MKSIKIAGKKFKIGIPNGAVMRALYRYCAFRCRAIRFRIAFIICSTSVSRTLRHLPSALPLVPPDRC